jgi:hypothetical protein
MGAVAVLVIGRGGSKGKQRKARNGVSSWFPDGEAGALVDGSYT